LKPRLLSQEEIDKAKMLKERGLTKRQLAVIFEVSSTTIWYSVYAKEKRVQSRRTGKIYTFRNIQSVGRVVQSLKGKDYSSLKVATILNIPLNDVNYLWTKNI